jgi:hypothetical protein
MKRLLLLISLICAVPMVAGIHSPANAGNQTVTKKGSSLSSSNGQKKKAAFKQGQPADMTTPSPSAAPSTPVPDPSAVPSTPVTPELPTPTPGASTPATPGAGTPAAPDSVAPEPSNKAVPDPSGSAAPVTGGSSNMEETQKLRMQLDGISRQEFDIKCPCYGSLSPGMTIFNPAGYGADNNTIFLSGSYQNRTRFTNTSDGELGIGIGLGDARNAIGAEISYTIDSFGRSQGFGSGGFNAKIHKAFSDDFSVALGWNRFASVKFNGGANGAFDYPKNSYYLSASKIFSTTENVDSFLSRIAVTGGVGSGTFLSERTLQDAFAQGRDATGLNVFGSLGLRIAKPLSAVVEWTGQDLAAGLSLVPFDGFPLVISPSFRDITGAGNGSRFVLGTGIAYTF